MFLMLAKQKLIGHASNIIAHDYVTWIRTGHLFEGIRHGSWLLQVEGKKLLETKYGMPTVFGNQRVAVNVGEEKTFQLGILHTGRLTKPGKSLGCVAYVFDRTDPRTFGEMSGVGYQITDKHVENVP